MNKEELIDKYKDSEVKKPIKFYTKKLKKFESVTNEFNRQVESFIKIYGTDLPIILALPYPNVLIHVTDEELESLTEDTDWKIEVLNKTEYNIVLKVY